MYERARSESPYLLSGSAKAFRPFGDREEALVGVHPRAVDPEDRLGHERRVEAVELGDRLEGELEGERVVGGLEGVRVLEVDLVLARRDLVVRRLDRDPEGLERVHHVLADFLREVGGEVEVAGEVVRERGDLPGLVAAEEEELQLGAHVHDVAELPGALHLAAEDVAGVAGEGLAARREDVADDAGGAARAVAGLPGDLGEGRHVRHEVLVGLGDPGEALDRRPVEPGPVPDRVLHPVDRDRHGLDDPQDVGELQLDEADAVRLRLLDLLHRAGLGHVAPPRVERRPRGGHARSCVARDDAANGRPRTARG